jgi:hypothetical protein
MNADFPDQFAVEFLRDSLWRDVGGGRASVMVGAGFSRNANASSPSSRPMPTWPQMSSALCASLYAAGGKETLANAMQDASSTSGFLRLAQEYEAAYGRVALNQQIRNLVPDLDYEPGELHRRLLSLPWTNVFTTNWDTLLERASRDVHDYDYDIIRTASEIPTSRGPRIVKLHGSFPAFEPFIFTEDDYRKYPRSHAPFVNMVQQGLMESTLCLLGFSGDDPNFLHWSGWVRDNFGETAPKIFLVGWLDLSPHRRKLLEARNVVPVDLSYLPYGKNWPKHLRQQYATEWFLRAIAVVKRFNPVSWPDLSEDIQDSPDYLGPVPQRPNEELPRAEPLAVDHVLDKKQQAQSVQEAAKVWNWNRRLYPGWTVAPASVRQTIWQHTHYWIEQIATAYENIRADEYLLILDELLWRLDIALKPYFQQIIDVVRSTISKIDVLKGIVQLDGSILTAAEIEKWPSVVSAWGRVALVLARDSRMDGTLDEVFPYVDTLTALSVHDAELKNALTYELCLWYRSAGDLHKFHQLLDHWDVSNADTVWAVRRAGLLSLLGNHKLAAKLVNLTLSDIRRNRRRDIIDYRALSREAWSLWFQMAVDNISMASGNFRNITTRIRSRWRELAVYGCDAFNEYQRIVTNIELSAAEKQSPLESERTFDLGSVKETVHLTGDLPERILHGYELFRLAEMSGLPPKLHHSQLISDGLNKAVQKLADDNLWLCATWTIWISTSATDKALKFISRERIATLGVAHVDGLRRLLLGEIDYARHHRAEDVAFWSERLGVCLEVFSRLVLRLQNRSLDEAMALSLSIFRSPLVADEDTFHRPIKNLIRRILEAMSSQRVEELLGELFTLPLTANNSIADQSFPDVVSLLPTITLSAPKNSAMWDTIAARLLQDMERGQEILRKRALYRLYHILKQGLVSENMRNSIALEIWSPKNLSEDNWPVTLPFRDFAVMGLPELTPGQAQTAFRQRYLSLGERAGVSVANRIIEVADAVSYSKSHQLSFSLNDLDHEILRELISTWASSKKVPSDPLRRFFSRINGTAGEREVLKALAALLPTIQLSPDDAEGVWQKASSALEEDIDVALPVLTVLIAHKPEKADELSQTIRQALVSSSSKDCRGACAAIYRWIILSESVSASPIGVPLDLIREVGLGVASRRLSLLLSGLELLTWIFETQNKNYQSLALDESVHALNYLHEQAVYNNETLRAQDIDISLLRLYATRLAKALHEAGYVNVVIDRWLRSAAIDVMPEIRKAVTER